MNATPQKLVVFDVETTGLDPCQHEVSQFAAVALGPDWEPVGELEVKLRFNLAKASPDALAVNSYDAATWKREAVSPAAAVESIGEFLRAHATFSKVSKAGKPYSVARVCAHNAPFDCDFLAALFRMQVAFCPAAIYEPLCTLSLARWLTFSAGAAIENHKLETVCEFFGIAEEGEAHDALSDVRRTAALARRLAGIVSAELRTWPFTPLPG